MLAGIVPQWLEVAAGVSVALAALLSALAIIIRLLLKPVAERIRVVLDRTEVLMDIAEDFQPNGHPGLKETIVSIEERIEDLIKVTKDTGEQLVALDRYTHERMHEFANSLTVVKGNLELHSRGRLKTRSDDEDTQPPPD